MSKNTSTLIFDADESYEKRCGEIYLNIEGVMVFQCTLCLEKYLAFEKYAQHVEKNHKLSMFIHVFCDNSEVESLGSNIDIRVHCDDEVYQSISVECDVVDISGGVKAEKEALNEVEFPIEKLKNKTKSRKKHKAKPDVEKKSVIEVNANNGYSMEVEQQINTVNCDETTKPIEIRPIRKKTNYFLNGNNDIRPFLCNLCDATFKDSSTLSKHKARHRTEKNHPCPKCQKMFYTTIDVKKHLITHSGSRPFLCNICGKTLISNVKLKDHMRRHNDQRDYECSVCKKRFYNSNLLSSHKLVHKNEKSFSCSFCDSRFTFKKGLQNHLKLHENKREYKCDLCDADFNQQAGLFCHKKTKHQIGLNLLNLKDLSF